MSESGGENDDAMRLDDLQEQNLDSVRGSGVPDVTFDLQDQQFDTFQKGDDGEGQETK